MEESYQPEELPRQHTIDEHCGFSMRTTLCFPMAAREEAGRNAPPALFCAFIRGIIHHVSANLTSNCVVLVRPDHVWTGAVLWGLGPVLCGHVGAVAQQHVCGCGLHQLRVVLDELCHLPDSCPGALVSLPKMTIALRGDCPVYQSVSSYVVCKSIKLS